MLVLPTAFDEVIIRLLAKSTRLRAEDILSGARAVGHVVSIQAVYKALRKLRAEGVVVHEHGSFSLSLTWVLGLEHFTREAMSVAAAAVAARRTHGTFRFRSLAALQDVWIELLSDLIREEPSSPLHQWVPFPWFVILQARKSVGLLRLMDRYRTRMHVLVKGEDPLTQEYVRTAKQFGGDYRCRICPDFAPNDRYYTVNSSALIEVRIDPDTTDKLRRLFLTASPGGAVRPENLRAILGSSCTARLSYSRDTRRISPLLRRFEEAARTLRLAASPAPGKRRSPPVSD